MTTPWHDMTAVALGAAIGRGAIDPVALAEHFLDRIESGDADHRIYLRMTRDRALAEASAARDRARRGVRIGPLDGVPISWKDLYDTAGIETMGGSPLLAGRVPGRDAAVLARATRAGMVCLGKTNLVEFALGGLGTNIHTGTPANPYDAAVPRCPGGSSSGAATSVARGQAAAAIGSDTGGSVRIPAAWNRLVGLKTSFGLLPLDGVLPLAPSLDTVGPLTRDVADANALLAVLAAAAPADLASADIRRMSFLVPETVVWDRTDAKVAAVVRGGIDALGRAGARIVAAPVPELAEIEAVLDRHGGLVVAEGYHTWRAILEAPDKLARVDPNVRARMLQGRAMTATDVAVAREQAQILAARLYARAAGHSAILAPTVPIPPPPIAEVETDTAAYARHNMAALSNTRLGNVLAGCAITLPCGMADGLPVGLMMMGPLGHDRLLLRCAAAAEPVLSQIAQ